MQYTYGQLKRAIEHAIAGQPDASASSPRFTSGQIVNRAISHLANAHRWTWRLRFSNLTLTGGSSVITLDTFFGELVSVQRASYAFESIRQLLPQEYQTQQWDTWDGKHLGYILLGAAQTTNSAAPLMQLGVAPIPTATHTNALSVGFYRIIPAMTDIDGNSQDAHIPDVPAKVHHVLLALCRAYAVTTEDQKQDGPEWAEANRLLTEAIQADQRSDGGFVQTVQGGETLLYSFARLKSDVVASMGPEAQKINAGQIVNDAIQHVTNAYPWRWRQKQFTYTQPGSPVETITLPSDFVMIQNVEVSGREVHLRPTEDYYDLKIKGSYAGTIATVTYNARSAATDAPTPVLLVQPATATQVFNVSYLSGATALQAEGDVPNMPPPWHPLVARAARMIADNYKDKPTGVDRVAYEQLFNELVGQEAISFPPARLPRVTPVRETPEISRN